MLLEGLAKDGSPLSIHILVQGSQEFFTFHGVYHSILGSHLPTNRRLMSCLLLREKVSSLYLY
jgi:hypothetical protein